MQRLYSTFASGWPGIGLLLLRLAVSTVALLGARGLLGGQQTVPALVWMACGGLLLLGLATPVAGAMTMLSAAGYAGGVPSGAAGGLPEGWLFPGFVAAVAAAIVLLGPGAFSVDARLFGRREIIIPRAPGPARD